VWPGRVKPRAIKPIDDNPQHTTGSDLIQFTSKVKPCVRAWRWRGFNALWALAVRLSRIAKALADVDVLHGACNRRQ